MLRVRVDKPYKYYTHRHKSNTWNVFFTNRTHLSHDEINQFFSKYGEIAKIDFTNNRSICFVHFKTEEAAKLCTQRLKQNDTIRLRPFTRPDDYPETRRNSSPDEVGESLTEYSANCENSAKRNEESISSSASNLRRPKDFCMSDASLTSVESISMDSKESSKSPDHEGNSGSTNTASDTPKDLPDLVHRRETVSYKQKWTQPVYLPVRPRRMALTAPAVVPDYILAEEVIVANIPERCGVDTIVQLFRELHPICASNMKVVVESGLRYCHVYFETLREAKAAEAAFDDAKLYGRKIIVLHADTLGGHTWAGQRFF